MRPTKRTCLAVLLAALLVGAGLSGCQQPIGTTTASRIKDPEQAPEPGPRLLEGTLSCSGRGCHASLDQPEKGPLWQCSYSLWLDNDPHANAYRVLSEPKGRQMARALNDDVTKNPRCLACHVTPQAATLPIEQGQPPQEWASGVGCESCHGPAQKWLVPHRSEKWKHLKAEQKERDYGMNNLTTLAGRAKVCVGCHVGAAADPKKNLPLRDMNHDHIAAGHPRLMFEFGAFLANEPPHWREKITGPDREARAWLVGQVVSAQAALDLLADRASQHRAADRPWPEFSEYDCSSCHHGLHRDSWRQERDLGRQERGSPKGRPRFGLWYPGLLDVVAPVTGAAKPGFLPELERAMIRPYPPASQVAVRARRASKALEGLAGALGKVPLPADRLAQLRRDLAQRGADSFDPKKPGRQTDWDSVEQLALGLLALSQAEGNKPTQELARALLKELAFPDRHDSNPNFRRIKRDDAGKPSSPFDEDLKKRFDALK